MQLFCLSCNTARSLRLALSMKLPRTICGHPFFPKLIRAALNLQTWAFRGQKVPPRVSPPLDYQWEASRPSPLPRACPRQTTRQMLNTSTMEMRRWTRMTTSGTGNPVKMMWYLIRISSNLRMSMGEKRIINRKRMTITLSQLLGNHIRQHNIHSQTTKYRPPLT